MYVFFFPSLYLIVVVIIIIIGCQEWEKEETLEGFVDKDFLNIL